MGDPAAMTDSSVEMSAPCMAAAKKGHQSLGSAKEQKKKGGNIMAPLHKPMSYLLPEHTLYSGSPTSKRKQKKLKEDK